MKTANSARKREQVETVCTVLMWAGSSDPALAGDPIIGYNVIEAIINRNEGKTKDYYLHL